MSVEVVMPQMGESITEGTVSKWLKNVGDKIEKDDIFAGLTAVLTVRLAEPQFEGQTKEILGTSAVRAIVAKA